MTWLSIKDVAGLLFITDRAVRKKVNEGHFENGFRYIQGAGRGGKSIEICLESLPEYAQVEYYKRYLETDDRKRIHLQREINTTEKYTNKQKEKGELRSKVIIAYRKHEKKQKESGENSKKNIYESFIETWNSSNPNFTISVPTLYRWLKKSKVGNAEKLVDKRGGYNRGQSSIPSEMWDLFCNYYLRETKPTIKSCYETVRLEANLRKITIPSFKAFEYAVKKIPQPILTIGREGFKAFEDSCIPTAERDYTKLNSNDLWVSDHHVWDIQVIVKVNGEYRKVRPWGTYWLDMRSRMIVSRLIRAQDPNSDAVLCSFAEGVKEFGIPKAVYLDNGKDYKALDLFNSDKERMKVASLAVQMDIEPHYAIPYNAKAKPLERTFKTFESQFGKLFQSYLGRNPVERPEDLKKVKLENYPTLEDFKAIHDDYFKEFYNKSSHNGISMNGYTPEIVYHENLKEKRTASEEVLRLWLMRTAKPRKVHKNGITIDGVNYRSSEMVLLIGKEVYARYSPDNKDVVYIYDLNDNPLCTAFRREKMSFNPSKEDYRKLNKEKSEARRLVKSALPPKDKSIGTVENIKHILELKKAENELKEKINMDTSPIIVPVRNENLENASKIFNMSATEKARSEALLKQKEQETLVNEQHKNYLQNLSDFYESQIQSSNKTKVITEDIL